MCTLYVRDGDEYRPAAATEVFARAHALISQRYRPGAPVLKNPEQTRQFLRLHLGACDHEIFGVLHLDTRGCLIAIQDLFRGTVTRAAVYPREVVKAAVDHNAAAVILFHNHPSGVSEPSQADEDITKRIKEALSFFDVTVLDHVVVADGVFSFAEHGLI